MYRMKTWKLWVCTIAALVLASATAQAQSVGGCGYSIQTGTYAVWPGGYQAWVKVTNHDGAVGTDFRVLVDLGGTQFLNGWQAEYSAADSGYYVDAPSWLVYQKIRPGQSFTAAFNGAGAYEGLDAYLLSINGEACDLSPPQIDLSLSQELFTSEGTLTLSADVSDDVVVRKVVFEQDGAKIAEDWEAPYEIDIPISELLNGRHLYTATAVDPSNNEASDSKRLLVAIGNRFVGSAVGGAADYPDFLAYFDQVTPENAGKWGSVEATRDQMDWEPLDAAYALAKENGLPFRLHTLVWGAQQPSWLAELGPGEQLDELLEWMAALAERYPDVDFVDVVNEPLHSTPSYSEALGGSGATGVDWVLTAFELARLYFPNAELHLNDYQIVIFGDFTTQYLAIIQELQALDLIDGIGIQAHFLERAEVSVVEANLQTLADTGLPIYVTEFDVNFADDARHANVYADLFTTFWDNPSVLGVTNWGFRQGATWQSDSHLVDANGVPRPALSWMLCYVAGGDDCPVPEYVPAPWVGDEYGVTLEAELYDEASGVLALGDVIGYTDPGDNIRYLNVGLQEEWDTFAVTYAKGNTGGSISVFIDDELAPVLTLELPPTAGWGTAETLEAPWPLIGGNHAVTIVFNDAYGVANVDKVRVGTAPPPPSMLELISNGGFEGGSGGWYSWNGSVSVSTEKAHSGTSSLLVSGGSATGPAATELSGVAVLGLTYDVSMWVSVGGVSSAPVNATVALDCGEGPEYIWVAGNDSVPSDGWVNLSGTIAVPADCELGQFQLYAEGALAADLYVDDVSVTAPISGGTSNVIANGDFEGGSDGWYSWGGTTIGVSGARSRSGAQSLLVTGDGTGPAATSLVGLVAAGHSYGVSFWVSVGGVETAQVNVTLALDCGDGTSYSWIGNNDAVPSDDWVEISGVLDVPELCTMSTVQLYAEGSGSAVDLYLDDVVISE